MNLKLCVDLNKIEEIYQPGIFSTSFLYVKVAVNSKQLAILDEISQ